MTNPIPALLPRTESGHQFVCYADSCSGVPNALHETTFANVNAIVSRLDPPPEFICFPGDEIIGLTADNDALRQQWRHWFEREMAWLDRAAIPLYHTTGNHTTYDAHSERIYQEVMVNLPNNGPIGQEQLAYFVRRDDLLMIFVNTLDARLGGEGFVETEWLAQTLSEHADARHKLVFGHHPVFPVNGYVGELARNVDAECGQKFWSLLVEHDVLAYFCSHILAFDVQVHDGVLQILTAGAGTAHRMPESVEYLHALQAALDEDGLRYQVLDTDGTVRESLTWPLADLAPYDWQPLAGGINDAPFKSKVPRHTSATGESVYLLSLKFTGVAPLPEGGARQTILSAWNSGPHLAPLWIGLIGANNQLTISMAPTPGRSPHLWFGPCLDAGKPFSVQLTIHSGMGPGGLLWRWDENKLWSSMRGTAAWGAERLVWPDKWSVGHGQRGTDDEPFRGADLTAGWVSTSVQNHR